MWEFSGLGKKMTLMKGGGAGDIKRGLQQSLRSRNDMVLMTDQQEKEKRGSIRMYCRGCQLQKKTETT